MPKKISLTNQCPPEGTPSPSSEAPTLPITLPSTFVNTFSPTFASTKFQSTKYTTSPTINPVYLIFYYRKITVSATIYFISIKTKHNTSDIVYLQNSSKYFTYWLGNDCWCHYWWFYWNLLYYWLFHYNMLSQKIQSIEI